jgi:hypothetical protein
MAGFDTVKPVMDYFEDNMKDIIGTGNKEVKIYRDVMTDDSFAESISVGDELTESTEFFNNCDSVSDIGIMKAALRINVRGREKDNSYDMSWNVDKLLDLMVRKMITDTVELVLCKRNAGPSWFRGIDNLHYHTMLYTATLRKHG